MARARYRDASKLDVEADLAEVPPGLLIAEGAGSSRSCLNISAPAEKGPERPV
jgi:hypothetical protein